MNESNTRILIQNSGLILLWPFFTRYFEQLQLVTNGAFVSHEARNRAVYLLQYLVINEIDFPEYELVLNKQLVGIPMEEPLLPIDALTQDEIALAESLLNGFRANWEKVASSTIMAIQETFLYREGLLDIQNDKSILAIEKRGVDILVSTIPWNFSLIKLPWMQQPLYIDWL